MFTRPDGLPARLITGLLIHTPTYADLPAIQSLMQYTNGTHEVRSTLTIQGRHPTRYNETRHMCAEPIPTHPATPLPSPWLGKQPPLLNLGTARDNTDTAPKNQAIQASSLCIARNVCRLHRRLYKTNSQSRKHVS